MHLFKKCYLFILKSGNLCWICRDTFKNTFKSRFFKNSIFWVDSINGAFENNDVVTCFTSVHDRFMYKNQNNNGIFFPVLLLLAHFFDCVIIQIYILKQLTIQTALQILLKFKLQLFWKNILSLCHHCGCSCHLMA